MIRDLADHSPTGLLLVVLGIGVVGLIVFPPGSAPELVTVIFALAFVVGGFSLLLKGLVALWDAQADQLELTGRVSDQSHAIFGPRQDVVIDHELDSGFDRRLGCRFGPQDTTFHDPAFS